MRRAESSEASARKNTDAEDDAFRVIEKPLFRHKSRSVTLAETPPPPKPEPVRRPAKVAQQLALAHHLQAAIDRGAIADRADVARKLGLTRARVTQLLDLLLLAPDLQDAVLALEAVERTGPLQEGKPPVLFVLDEFAALGHMPSIEKAAGQIASFGVKRSRSAASSFAIARLFSIDSKRACRKLEARKKPRSVLP